MNIKQHKVKNGYQTINITEKRDKPTFHIKIPQSAHL